MPTKPITIYAIFYLVFAFMILPIPANADGNNLLKACTAGLKVINKEKNLSGKELVDAAFCAGLIQGITDANRINKMSGGSSLFCLPGDVINKADATHTVVNYLRAHPEKLKFHESNLVIEAITKAFPCR
jgi:hypothetical protein